MSDDDAALWRRVRDGDESGLAALFDRHEARLYRLASRLLTSRADAKDAVTVAFFELWRLRNTVRLVDGSPLPWLLHTVSSAARDLTKASRRYRDLMTSPSVEAQLESASDEDASDALTALRRVSPREQSVLVLAGFEGYTPGQAAAALGMSAGAATTRLTRAKAKLRDEIAGMEESWA